MAGGVGAGTVADPETGAVGGEECVAFAFEGRGARRVDDVVAGELEPTTEVRLFALTLEVEEAADGDGAVALKACVGSEDHVRRAGFRIDELDVGDGADGVEEALPLFGCASAGGAVDVAGHPGIDDVVDVVERRGAHQKCRAGGDECGKD